MGNWVGSGEGFSGLDQKKCGLTMSNSEYNRTIGKTIDRKQSDTIVVATVRLSSDAIIRYMDYRPNGVFDSS